MSPKDELQLECDSGAGERLHSNRGCRHTLQRDALLDWNQFRGEDHNQFSTWMNCLRGGAAASSGVAAWSEGMRY